MSKELAEKYSRDKWPMYTTYYICQDPRNKQFYIGERVYATYDKPDWSSLEKLTTEEAYWMNDNSDVKFRYGLNV